MRTRWDLYGVLAGLVVGVMDYALMQRLGVEMTWNSSDASLYVGAFFALNYAALGFVIGRLVIARSQARADAEVIQNQMKELEASQRAVLQNEKLAAIGRLAVGVSHEVRNPLGVIRASASMVQESFKPEDEAYRACEFIRDEIDRLNGFITSLLGFARPKNPRFESASIDKVVERAMRLAEDEFSRRRIRLECEQSGPLPELQADPDLLAQLFLGLLLNAAEELEGGGRVVIRMQAGPECLNIEVADSGPGIPPDDAERIFEPFFTTKARGTGLGLAMADRIARAHGGEIGVVQGRGASSDRGGACFRIGLPLGGWLQTQGAA